MKKLIMFALFGSLLFLTGCMSDTEDYEPTANRDYVKDGYLTENYNLVEGDIREFRENDFTDSSIETTSTFSIDVDTASYSLFRKFIVGRSVPPSSSIRTEEMVNYFDYDYDQPLLDNPFSIDTVLADCPWNTDNDLLMIAIQAKDISYEAAPANNLVFLIDVSGSMRSNEKLDNVKASLALLVENLREIDYVSIVTYASTAEVVLEPTSGDNKDAILEVLNGLSANGGTNGSGGIDLAYDLAYETFIFDGNNRVILATDGDFNIGTTSSQGLINIVTEKAEIGIYLTILAFGQNHAAADMMERLSNDGQGNYYFIDTLAEADKVLNYEIVSTIVPIADDVKIQVEFNSDIVESYRLIGYENRVLSNDVFEDDTVDAGDAGAGSNVTAFYEITYKNAFSYSDDLATVRVRYKDVGEDISKLVEGVVKYNDYEDNPSSDFLFASAVVEISLLMRDSEFKANANFTNALARIENNIGTDQFGLRLEFFELAQALEELLNK